MNLTFLSQALHAIRELTHQLNEYRTHGVHLAAESLSQVPFQSEYDEKLERCCQRLEQLTTKVDRLISFEQTGMSTETNIFSLKYKVSDS